MSTFPNTIAIVTGIGLVAALACGRPPASGDASETEAQLIEADLAFARATKAEGVEGWTQAFAENGIFVQSGGLRKGRDEIRTAMGILDGGNVQLSWKPEAAAVAASGDLGYTYGRYRTTAKIGDGEQQVASGWYTTIWRRQRDGTWKVELDIGSPDPPPQVERAMPAGSP